MKKLLVAFVLGLLAATGIGYAITVNPASNVTADSDNTAGTIVLRDTSGNFAASAITATSIVASAQVGAVRSWSRTKAQFDVLVPTAVGEVYFCSNCSTPNLCVSTGTAASQFLRVDSTSAGCGTSN